MLNQTNLERNTTYWLESVSKNRREKKEDQRRKKIKEATEREARLVDSAFRKDRTYPERSHANFDPEEIGHDDKVIGLRRTTALSDYSPHPDHLNGGRSRNLGPLPRA